MTEFGEVVMVVYADKHQLMSAIKVSAAQYLKEFDPIDEMDKNLRLGEGKTPYENIAYQLGWMDLLHEWERQEQAGIIPAMPAPGVKWNKLGVLHQRFYSSYASCSMQELKKLFESKVEELCVWLDSFDDDMLFKPGGRRWAQSTPSNWPVWKWVHINTVAPFTTFRSQIRRWKRLRFAK